MLAGSGGIRRDPAVDPEESKSEILSSNSFNTPFVILFMSGSMWRGVDPERSGGGSGGIQVRDPE